MIKDFRKLHPGQIPTKLSIIRDEVFMKGHDALYSLLYCMISELDSPEYKNHLICAALWLERLSCYVYLSGEGQIRRYEKPDEEFFRKNIFESWAETPEEVKDWIEGSDKYPKSLTIDEAKKIYRKLWLVADIVCHMMACLEEQAFISEYAYAIDYVIRHDGDLERPSMGMLFPRNYPDFNYTEGIAEELDRYEFM